MKMLSWLMAHYHKRLAPQKWADLLGIRIIDDDGWRQEGADFNYPIDLDRFIRLVSLSTIDDV